MTTNPSEPRKSFSANLGVSYARLRAVNLTVQPIREGLIDPGTVSVLVEGPRSAVLEGTLQASGVLTGMTWLYNNYSLAARDSLPYEVRGQGADAVVVLDLREQLDPPPATPHTAAGAQQTTARQLVFERMQLKHLHIEPFRPESLSHWAPENETDVYMAFGVLAELTDYRYCCGASQQLLDKLGAKYETKPDAILIDKRSDLYLMAEWKKTSSDYSGNHKPEDVDVLVCWIDDESDRSKLPGTVLALSDVAREAAALGIRTARRSA